MFGLFDRRPWVIEQYSNGPNGQQTTILHRQLMSRKDAQLRAKKFNQVSPYGRTYVYYFWSARPATPEEISEYGE